MIIPVKVAIWNSHNTEWVVQYPMVNECFKVKKEDDKIINIFYECERCAGCLLSVYSKNVYSMFTMALRFRHKCIFFGFI